MPELSRHSEDTPTERANRAAKERARARDAVLADEAAIDEAIEMTFPASDPPAWTSRRDRTSEIEPDGTGQP